MGHEVQGKDVNEEGQYHPARSFSNVLLTEHFESSTCHPPKFSSHHNMATVVKNVEEDPQSPPPTPTLTPSTEARHDPVSGYHPQAPSHSPFHQSPQRSGVLTPSPNVSHSIFKGTKGKQKRSSTKQAGALPTTPRRRSRFSPSLTLKNSGNTARDHLASERTFLAYVRTSLAMASAGVGVFHIFLCASMPMMTCLDSSCSAV